MHAYGVDVLDPSCTPRRIWVLAERLPPGARRFGEAWSTEAELLAGLHDLTAALIWVTAKAAGAKNVPRPRPLPRPRARANARGAGVSRQAEPGTVKTGSWAEAAALLGAMPGVEVVTEGG